MPNATWSIQCHALGSGYHNAETGWYLFDSMKESCGRPDYTWGTWGDEGETSYPESTANSVKFIQEIDALICMMYPRAFDVIPMSEWLAFGTGNVFAEEATGEGNLSGNWYHQMPSNLTSEVGMYMANNVPPNPAFGVLLSRASLTKEWVAANGEGWSKIVWGGGRFMLIIPYRYPAMLFDYVTGNQMEIPIGRSPRQGANNTEFDQEIAVWIAHLGGKVLISSDDRHSWHVYSVGEGDDAAIITDQGPIQVSNLGAAWRFRMIPIDYPYPGRFDSKVYNKGYTPSNSTQGGGPGGLWGDARWNSAEGYEAPSVWISLLEDGADICQYEAELTPANYAVGSTYFGHTPELYSVRIMNYPVCQNIISLVDPVISINDCNDLLLEDAGDVQANRALLNLNNNSGNFAGLLEYMPMEITLQNPDGVSGTPFCGYTHLLNPTENSKSGKWYNVQCVSASLPMIETQCLECEPVFSGWTVGEALEWVGLRCGIDFDKATYDTGTVLPLGKLGSRTWQPGAGRSWMDFVKQICEYEQYYIRFNGWDMMYLPEAAYSIAWNAADRANYPGAPVGTMPMLGQMECPRNPEQHRSQVIAIGQTDDGAIVSAKCESPAIIALIGWPKTVVLSDPSWNTQEQVNLVAATVFNRVSGYPPSQPAFEVDGNPAILPRHYVKLWGGVSAYDRQVFKITHVSHVWNRSTGREFRTQIQGKWFASDI